MFPGSLNPAIMFVSHPSWTKHLVMFPLFTIYIWETLHPGKITPSSSAFLYSLFFVSCHHLSVLFFSSCFLPLPYSSCFPQPTFPLIEPCPRSELKSCLISRKFPMIFFNGNSTFKSVFLAAQTSTEAGLAFSSPLDKWDRKKVTTSSRLHLYQSKLAVR